MLRNKIHKEFLAIALIGIFFSFAGYETVNSCELRAGYDENKPFHYTNEKGKVEGTDADVLRETLNAMGCKIKFEERPWVRTLKEIREGKVDIAIGAKFIEERAQFAYYSVPYKYIQHGLFTLEGKYKDVSSLEDFLNIKNTKLGVVRGWGYPPGISSIINDPVYSDSIHAVSSFEQLPQLLDIGRLQGIIAIPESLEIQIKGKTFTHKLVARAFYQEQLHFLFSKKTVSPEKYAEFNSSLLNLINNGRVGKILDKYKMEE